MWQDDLPGPPDRTEEDRNAGGRSIRTPEEVFSAYIDAPVSLTEQFKCSYVCLNLEREQSSGTHRGMRLRG